MQGWDKNHLADPTYGQQNLPFFWSKGSSREPKLYWLANVSEIKV